QTRDHHVVPRAPVRVDPVELLKVDVRSRAPGGVGKDAGTDVERVLVPAPTVNVDVGELPGRVAVALLGDHAHRVEGEPLRPDLRSDGPGLEVEGEVEASGLRVDRRVAR